MNPTGLHALCRQRLNDEMPEIAALVAGAADGAELALVALTVPDAITLRDSASCALRRGFRAAVRDRYAALVQEHQWVLEPG